MSDLVQQMADTLDTDEAEASRRLMDADWPEVQRRRNKRALAVSRPQQLAGV